MNRILLASPHMSDEGYELLYIHDAFEKNWIAPLGENVRCFEAELGSWLGVENTVALSAGTAALHLAVLLSGAGRGDKVFCQDLTFSASANPIAYTGAEPVFIDSEADSWNMDPDALLKAIETYGVPKTVIAVHLYGNPAKIDEIADICSRYGCVLIEDAAEALGSEYGGRKCGTFGEFGVLSFNGNKIITTSGGGMLICRKEEDAAHALKLATQAREPFAWYEHREIGYNYRLSNICAGIGRGQVKVLSSRIEKKRGIYEFYKERFSDLPLYFQCEHDGARSNRWLSAALIDPASGVDPKRFLEFLDKDNIEGRHLWKPMHMQPVYKDAAFVSAADAPVSEKLFSRGICLPSDTKMTDGDMERVAESVRRCFGK